jgi:hypothetical protein
MATRKTKTTKKATEKVGAKQDTTKKAPARDRFGARLDSHFALVNAGLSKTVAKTMKELVAEAKKRETKDVCLRHTSYYDHLNRLVSAKKVQRHDDGERRTYLAII